jgi:hypothetical protein
MQANGKCLVAAAARTIPRSLDKDSEAVRKADGFSVALMTARRPPWACRMIPRAWHSAAYEAGEWQDIDGVINELQGAGA